MQKELNEKQQEILDFVNKQVEEKGYPPSVREIGRAVGFKSTSTVHGYLQQLEEKGIIKKDPAKPRALKVIGDKPKKNVSSVAGLYSKKELVDVPIIGKVTAGQPILAVENMEGTFPLPVEYLHNSNAFMLRVRGDSMVEAGILNNDLVLVKQQPTANNGEIVVALIEDEATIKTFYKEKNYIRLQPENQHMEPIIVKDNMSIIGKVVGVFRKL